MEIVVAPILGTWGLPEPSLLAMLMVLVFGGAFVTSGFGIGGGVLMTPLVIVLLPPKFGIGLLAPLLFLMGGAGVRQYWKQWENKHILILLPSSLAGIWLGAYLLAEISPEVVRKTVGVLALTVGTLQLLVVDRPEWRYRLRPTDWQGVGFGFGAGISSALAHTGGIVFSFYLLPHSRTKEIFVGTTVFLFFIQGFIKMGTYVYYGILTGPILLLSLTLIPSLIMGSLMGKWLNRRIPNKLFLRLISIFVILMGAKLLVSP